MVEVDWKGWFGIGFGPTMRNTDMIVGEIVGSVI